MIAISITSLILMVRTRLSSMSQKPIRSPPIPVFCLPRDSAPRQDLFTYYIVSGSA